MGFNVHIPGYSCHSEIGLLVEHTVILITILAIYASTSERTYYLLLIRSCYPVPVPVTSKLSYAPMTMTYQQCTRGGTMLGQLDWVMS
jgi:hypothetical protein